VGKFEKSSFEISGAGGRLGVAFETGASAGMGAAGAGAGAAGGIVAGGSAALGIG